MTRHALWLTTWLVVSAAAQAAPRPDDTVRRFLSAGSGAPHPELTRAALETASVVSETTAAHPALGRRTRWLLREGGQPWVWVDVSEAGWVCHYALARGGALVVPRWRDDATPRPADEVHAEIEARCRLSAAELERRARRFLARADPGARPRRLERVRLHRYRENPVAVSLTFVERPRQGVLACYPNVLGVTLNPETGQVTEYSGSWVDAEATQLPAVTRADARRVARRGRPGESLGDPELSFLFRDGALRLVWALPSDGGLLVVDAHTGALLPARES
jgi:hypothetical protein